MTKYQEQLFVMLMQGVPEKHLPKTIRTGVWYKVIGLRDVLIDQKEARPKETSYFGVIGESLGLVWIPEFNCNVITENRLIAAKKGGLNAASPDLMYGTVTAGMS